MKLFPASLVVLGMLASVGVASADRRHHDRGRDNRWEQRSSVRWNRPARRVVIAPVVAPARPVVRVVHRPRVVVQPRYVYVQPSPVYVQPAPVYVQPPPPPAPVVDPSCDHDGYDSDGDGYDTDYGADYNYNYDSNGDGYYDTYVAPSTSYAAPSASFSGSIRIGG